MVEDICYSLRDESQPVIYNSSLSCITVRCLVTLAVLFAGGGGRNPSREATNERAGR